MYQHLLSHSNEALFNNAAIGIITVDTGGVIRLINNFAERLFGYEKEEVIGQKLEVLIPQRFRKIHTGHREKFSESSPHSRPMGLGMDLFAITKDGREFPVEVSLSAYDTPEGRFTLAFISDISIRKKSEQELINLNVELEQKVADRTRGLTEALEKEKELNELKSRFVSMASHEFRTPLSTILSSVYLIAKYQQTEEQPKRDKHIQRIVSSVNMLNDILNDFLSVGRIEEGRIQLRFAEEDVEELIHLLINELQAILKPGQEIHYRHNGAKKFMLDGSLLKHIGMNLLSNAIKFSPENKPIHIATTINNGEMTLVVKDEGMGIPIDDQQHLFERFFRAGNVINVQGTGLGLHIVGKYAELMNGHVSFKSEEGKGTTFTVQLKAK